MILAVSWCRRRRKCPPRRDSELAEGSDPRAREALPISDLFGVAGSQLLDRLDLPKPYAARITSLRRVMDLLDFEVDVFANLTRTRLARDPDYVAVQTIPGIGPTLGAVLVAEIGDVRRFATADKLTCWAGLTPEADDQHECPVDRTLRIVRDVQERLNPRPGAKGCTIAAGVRTIFISRHEVRRRAAGDSSE
jgi:transposase